MAADKTAIWSLGESVLWYSPNTTLDVVWSLGESFLVDEYVESVIAGETCWGHVTGVTETNVRTFTSNWIGTGTITGSGDSERIELQSGQYMESEVVNTGAGSISLSQNKYVPGDTVVLSYRTSATSEMSGDWTEYTGSFSSLGYVQVRVEVL